MPGWTLSGLLRSAGAEAQVRAEASVGGLAYDSRRVSEGDLFCCLPGRTTDGHSHASEAVQSGARALLVERWLDLEVPQARVDSVRLALGPLSDAFYHHPSRFMSVTAITGTNGKTTITYLLESIARSAGLECGVVGSVTRRYGSVVEPAARNTPEAPDLQDLLARMQHAGVKLVALEATSDGLAQHRLRSTRVAAAGFTNLTQDHLITHGSMDAYFEAKASLFQKEYTSRAVVNLDDPYGRRLAQSVEGNLDLITFGEDGDIAVTELELGADGSSVTCRTPAGVVRFSTHLVGRYNVSNCLCALGLALQCGIDPADAAQGIGALESMPGRLERVQAGQDFAVLVDYAHTPDALAQVLQACRELASKKVIVVFGCGGDRDRAKRPQMGEMSTRLADLAILTSDNPRSEDPAAILDEIEPGAQRGGGPYRSVIDRREAIESALSEAGPGDVVLIAGKGHEQGQQLADRTVPFDDRQVAREILASVLGEASCAQ